VSVGPGVAGLDAETALEALGRGRWRGEVSERWWIRAPTPERRRPGGPFGGYLAAMLVHALVEAVDDPLRPPRSLTVHFVDAPAPGAVEVSARVERTGGSATSVTLRLEQDGRACNAAWMRPKGAARLDHAAAAALSDTVVPAAFSRLGRLAAVPTLDLTIHFRAPLPPAGDEPWALAVFSSGLAAGGTWEEDGELWSVGGVLLTQSRQLAMIRA
jgi:acyl-CoA thioesterase